MSRTRRGSKGPGYDFWSRRPHSGAGYGREVKKRTHRTERREAKAVDWELPWRWPEPEYVAPPGAVDPYRIAIRGV